MQYYIITCIIITIIINMYKESYLFIYLFT